jgi:hypothetical protein
MGVTDTSEKGLETLIMLHMSGVDVQASVLTIDTNRFLKTFHATGLRPASNAQSGAKAAAIQTLCDCLASANRAIGA